MLGGRRVAFFKCRGKLKVHCVQCGKLIVPGSDVDTHGDTTAICCSHIDPAQPASVGQLNFVHELRLAILGKALLQSFFLIPAGSR